MKPPLEIGRFKVKQEPIKGEDAPKEPSFSSFHSFAQVCQTCKYRNEFFYPMRGAYNEADLLKVAQMAFNFARECGCHEQKEEPKAT